MPFIWIYIDKHVFHIITILSLLITHIVIIKDIKFIPRIIPMVFYNRVFDRVNKFEQNWFLRRSDFYFLYFVFCSIIFITFCWKI